MKKVYVLWSGGMDSTYLIDFILSTRSDAEVVAGYVELLNNDRKTICEKQAIDKLVPLFKAKYGNRFDYLKTVCSIEVNHHSQEFFALFQMTVWLSAIMLTLKSQYDEIAIGYVMNDCAVSYINELKAVYETFNGLRPPHLTHLPDLTFPIAKYDKNNIKDWLDSDVFDLVWCCENPNDGLPCITECAPCKRHPYTTEQKLKITNELTKRREAEEAPKQLKIEKFDLDVKQDIIQIVPGVYEPVYDVRTMRSGPNGDWQTLPAYQGA